MACASDECRACFGVLKRFIAAICLIVLLGFPISVEGAVDGETLWLNRERLHLRSGNAPEWGEFADSVPRGRRIDLRFPFKSNTSEAALFIRQDDVRQDWFIELNSKRLGKLFLMEADLTQTFVIPARELRDGENVLSIVPPTQNDDIVLREICLVRRPLADVLLGGKLRVRVRDEEGGGSLPCRLTFVDSQGTLMPLLGLSNTPPLSVRPGVVYTGNGQASIGLMAGEYTVYASRGFEWGVATRRVLITNGTQAELDFELRREVATPGWVSGDTHVHTFTHSRHGDATIEERMLTLAGEGIELPVITDHNLHIDCAEAARKMGVAEWFTPVTGNEVTTPAGHFNAFPMQPEARVPDFLITDWPRLMTSIRSAPSVRVVVLNHPRNVHGNFQPFASTNFNAVTGDNKRGGEFSFDAMEVLNSSAQQSDYMLVYRDWFALLNHGYRVTAVGSSDGHDVSRYIVGQGRTYIASADQRPNLIDVPAACSNLLAGRALVSMGLLAQMEVDGRFGIGDLATGLRDQVRVTVSVSGPSWVTVTNLALFGNGRLIREERPAQTHNNNASTARSGVKATVSWTLPRPAHDVYLVAIATGPGVTTPFWAIPRPYQPVSIHWQSRVIGSTNPIWLDADADERFTSARGYAQRIFNDHGTRATKLLDALGGFDQAVAAQAASLWVAKGGVLDEPDLVLALKTSTPNVQSAFAEFSASLFPQRQ